MTDCRPAIQLCETREFVCQEGLLVFQILGELLPAVNELEESFFVGFGNRDYLICNFYSAALNRFYFIDSNHI